MQTTRISQREHEPQLMLHWDARSNNKIIYALLGNRFKIFRKTNLMCWFLCQNVDIFCQRKLKQMQARFHEAKSLTANKKVTKQNFNADIQPKNKTINSWVGCVYKILLRLLNSCILLLFLVWTNRTRWRVLCQKCKLMFCITKSQVYSRGGGSVSWAEASAAIGDSTFYFWVLKSEYVCLEKNLRTMTTEVEENDKRYKASHSIFVIITFMCLGYDHIQRNHQKGSPRCGRTQEVEEVWSFGKRRSRSQHFNYFCQRRDSIAVCPKPTGAGACRRAQERRSARRDQHWTVSLLQGRWPLVAFVSI